MQLAGSQCCFCSRTVVMQTEATACARCKSVAHKDCLHDAGNACPACHAAWLDMADVIAYSERCPSCGARTSPAKLDRCGRCGSQTAWDSHEDYLVAKQEIHALGVRKAISGSVALLAGALFQAWALVILVRGDHYHGARYEEMFGGAIMGGLAILATFVFGGMAFALAWLGLRHLRTALPMVRFR